MSYLVLLTLLCKGTPNQFEYRAYAFEQVTAFLNGISQVTDRLDCVIERVEVRKQVKK